MTVVEPRASLTRRFRAIRTGLGDIPPEQWSHNQTEHDARQLWPQILTMLLGEMARCAA